MTLPIVGVGAAMIKLASDAEETQNRFNEVFKGIEGDAKAASKELAKDFDLAAQTSQNLLSDVGDLLTGIGLSKEESLEFGKSVVSLSSDIASFKNVQGGTERVVVAVTKALLGEREMLKDATKTAILEADVKERANEILKTRKDLTEQQAKAFATLLILQERNTAAVGDYARTKEGAANQTRALMQELKDLGAEFGTILLPLFIKGLKKVRELIEVFRGLSTEQKTSILRWAGIAAVIGPAIFALGAVAGAISNVIGLGTILFGVLAKLRVGFILWQAVLFTIKAATFAYGFAVGILNGVLAIMNALLFANPLGLIILAVVAVGAAIAALIIYWDEFVGAFKKGIELVKGGIGKVKAFFGIGDNKIETAERIDVTGAVDTNTANNFASIPPAGISGPVDNSRANTVKIDNINVDASGGDSSEIAANVANASRDAFQNTVQDFDSGIAR